MGIGKALLAHPRATNALANGLVAAAMVSAETGIRAVNRILQISCGAVADGRMDHRAEDRRPRARGCWRDWPHLRARRKPALMPSEIVLIVAVADNGVIGADGAIPWRLKSDMQRFKALTIGKPVVMGRKTFLSLRRPLPGRTNIVVTRDAGLSRPGRGGDDVASRMRARSPPAMRCGVWPRKSSSSAARKSTRNGWISPTGWRSPKFTRGRRATPVLPRSTPADWEEVARVRESVRSGRQRGLFLCTYDPAKVAH